MTKEEFLDRQYRDFLERYKVGKNDYYTTPAVSKVEPFKIADGLYYVGDKEVCIHLIDTGAGLILLDSGFFGSTYLLVDSIWRLGFDPKDVRYIIHTHGHFDHFGASEDFKKMYGTKLAISRVDAQSLRENPHRAYIDSVAFPFAKIPEFDYEIEDGEIFTLGNVKLRCVLTPGHTTGVLSLFWEVEDNGKTYIAGTYGGAGLTTLELVHSYYNAYEEDCFRQMEESIDKLLKEHVDIHLGNHPWNNNTIEKREKQLKEGGNPFIDSKAWEAFLLDLKEGLLNLKKENEKLEKSLDGVFGK